MKYFISEELSNKGEAVAEEFHSDKLKYARFKFVFVDKIKDWAKITKINPMYQALGIDGDFIIIVNKVIYDDLTPKQKTALLDHELCHAIVKVTEDDEGNEKIKFSIEEHDFEEFNCILERHGLWTDTSKVLAKTCRMIRRNKLNKENKDESDN